MAAADTLIQIDHYKNEQLIRLVGNDTHAVALNGPARPPAAAAADAAPAELAEPADAAKPNGSNGQQQCHQLEVQNTALQALRQQWQLPNGGHLPLRSRRAGDP